MKKSLDRDLNFFSCCDLKSERISSHAVEHTTSKKWFTIKNGSSHATCSKDTRDALG